MSLKVNREQVIKWQSYEVFNENACSSVDSGFDEMYIQSNNGAPTGSEENTVILRLSQKLRDGAFFIATLLKSLHLRP